MGDGVEDTDTRGNNRLVVAFDEEGGGGFRRADWERERVGGGGMCRANCWIVSGDR